MEVVAKRDNVDDGDQSMKIKLVMPDHVDPVDWNCYENITDITVLSTCSFLAMFLLKIQLVLKILKIITFMFMLFSYQ